jgi:glycosyltransferase involved in cell wall biosynthesis
VSKILGVAAYRGKLEEIAAQPCIDRLVAVAPPVWREPGGRALHFEAAPKPTAYELRVEPIWFNGNFHLFSWPTLRRILQEVRPDIVHLDEEPYNVATALGTLHARRVGARSLFFTWQNLLRRYPPPFNLLERLVFARSAHAIAGSNEALAVIRTKGYRGAASVIPQFGVDPSLFTPPSVPPAGVPRIGFIARLVEEKGIFVLLAALAELEGEWRLHVIGIGPCLQQAQDRAAALGLSERITWEPGVPSTQVAERMRSFSILVQPSLTRSNWKEQFGRALMEAMACGVAVVGSDSGEIPHVVGNAGIVVPEGDSAALCNALARLLKDQALGVELGQRARARVMERYTHARIAERTTSVYRSVLGLPARKASATMPA